MKLLMKKYASGLAAWLAVPLVGLAAQTKEWPKFQEVYDLVRTNLAGATEADLNRAAVVGFLSQLPQEAFLAPVEPLAPTNTPALLATNLFEGAYGFVRVARVSPELPDQLRAAIEGLLAANRLKGFVLDLRAAQGEDYEAAARAADLFLTTEQPLLTVGGKTFQSSAKAKAFSFLTTVLVNAQTRGAAEALAGMLRQADLALLIGAPTAGVAKVYTDYPLQDGRRLRVATGSIRLGNGRTLVSARLKPDILVPVSAEDERAYLADPFRILARNKIDLGLSASPSGDTLSLAGGTNRPPRHRYPRNEAELVRMQKEGESLDDDTTASLSSASGSPAKPSIQDPALARALDLLKGLALVRRIR